ncbi:MAG TPA: hypothetical protein VE987_04030 [Polyangiaceae bacterium]|nr:hypothetical protein [Polyangiaceae bacterium]
MQRWLTTLVGIAVVVLAVAVVTRTFRAPAPDGHAPATGSAATGADSGGLLHAYRGGGDLAWDAGGPPIAGDLLEHEQRPDAGPGTVMLDGSPVPPLPTTAPRQVHFGVVLVSYAGAQTAAGGPPPTRSRSEARALADRLAAVAQQDFHAAVQQGDIGSTDDLGQVKIGILEPAPEYVLFTLPVASTGGPVDTPRGYWIVKRLE